MASACTAARPLATRWRTAARAPMIEVRDAPRQLVAPGDDDLGGVRRRRGAHVGDEVGDRRVDLVPDAGDDRHRRGGDGAGDGLLVERPQILERAAAARDDHDVDAGMPRHVADGAGDLVAGALALDAARADQQPQAGVAVGDDAHDVAHRRALERGHDADGPRQQRQRTLARRGEQAFGLEPALQLLEGELERAEPARLEVLTDDLHLAARLVDLELAARDDVLAVGGLEAEQPQVAAEHHRLDLRGVVLEREVEMTRGGRPGVRDLALEPDLEELLLEAARDGGGQLADGVDGPRRRLGGSGGPRPAVGSRRAAAAGRGAGSGSGG